MIGTGTQFTTELKVGGAIHIDMQTFTVSAIASNTQQTLSQAHTAGGTAATAKTNAPPANASFVTLSSVSVLV